MKTGVRSALRRGYRLVPFKRPLFHLVRRVATVREPLYRHLHFTGEFTIRIGKRASFRMHHFGGSGENSLFWSGYRGDYEPVSLEVWRRLVPTARVIVDAGAHHGLYSLAARAMNPAATIAAFEPVPRLLDQMLENIRINGFRINAECMALSDATGSSTFYDLPEDQPVAASLDPEVARLRPDAIATTLQTIRLDDYLRNKGCDSIDLIKIDVERHEPAVIRGMGKMLGESRPSMLVEVLNTKVAREVEGLLEGLGYEYYRLDEEGRTVGRVARLDPGDIIGQNFLICTPATAARIAVDEIASDLAAPLRSLRLDGKAEQA